MTRFAEPTRPASPPWRPPLDTLLDDEQLIVVSDRAPWSHHRGSDGVQAVQPASSLVSAIEPVMHLGASATRTWIAHGSGNADREFADADDTCQVTSAGQPDGGYRLRYVWLSAEEQRGYRDGAANSGLWPLCHMVHVRPTFADSDWAAYRRINQRFADAVLREARRADPIVWVHYYHLALVPAMVRQRLPRARILGFWHIPWGHPEQMAICPWLAELTAGLLGCDTLAFQTATDSRHFNASARRCGWPVAMNLRGSALHRADSLTDVRDCAVSVAWPTAAHAQAMPTVAHCRREAAQRWSVPVDGKLIVGVDRFDYTKGLIERLQLTDAELAAVMGHEIAHALREHSREAMSKAYGTQMATQVGAALLGLGDAGKQMADTGVEYLMMLPNSRSNENEADIIGLELSARAGYDPNAAISLWQKMSKAGGGAPPEFMSTHPSSSSRIAALQAAIPKVMPLYQQARK